MTKQYATRLEDEDGPEVERLMQEEDRDASYVIRFLVHESLKVRREKGVKTLVVRS